MMKPELLVGVLLLVSIFSAINARPDAGPGNSLPLDNATITIPDGPGVNPGDNARIDFLTEAIRYTTVRNGTTEAPKPTESSGDINEIRVPMVLMSLFVMMAISLFVKA